MKRTRILGALATMVAVGSAAGPAAAQPSVAPIAASPASAGELAALGGVGDDVLADRAWMSPTALTQPEGSFTLSYLQLGPVGTAVGTYGVTERLQLTGIVMKPFGEDGGLYTASAKLQVVDAGANHLAIQGGITHFDEGTSEQVRILGVGAVGTICLDTLCRSLISGYLGAGKTTDDEETFIVASLSLTASMSARFKLVGELDRGFVRDSSGDEGTLGWLGARITGRQWAFDVGIVRPLEDGTEDLLPMVGLTYRGS